MTHGVAEVVLVAALIEELEVSAELLAGAELLVARELLIVAELVLDESHGAVTVTVTVTGTQFPWPFAVGVAVGVAVAVVVSVGETAGLMTIVAFANPSKEAKRSPALMLRRPCRERYRK